MTKQISPLRQRMIDDMAFRNMSPNTQKVYAYAVANFARFHRQSPDKLGIEHVRDYRLHLMSRGLKASSINPIVGALRFFYGTTLGHKELAEQIPFARVGDTLPAVLTREQVLQLLKAERSLKMRTIYITIYAAGLRVSEAVKLATQRYRQQAPSDPRPPGQGAQGSLRNAVGAAAQHPAQLLAPHTTA
jgi:integrase/recombinase XerD